MKIGQKGFALPQALLILVALLMVGGVGYYVYRANQNINETLDTANNSQNTPKTSKKKEETTTDKTPPASNVPDGWVKFSDEKTGVTFYYPPSIEGKFSVKEYPADEDVPLGYGAPVWWRYNASSDSWKTYKISEESTGSNVVKELTKNTFTLTKNKVGGKATFSATVGEGGGSTLSVVFPSGDNIYRINYPSLDWARADNSETEKIEDAQKASVEQIIKTIKL